MTAEELRDDLHFLVDDENLSSTQELSLINQAYDRIASMRPWNFLLSEDTTDTIVSGTVSYALPTDFLYGHEDGVVIYKTSTGEVMSRMKIVPYKDRMRYKNTGGYVTVDIKNNTLVFLASSDVASFAGYVIHLTYYAQPEVLEAADSPVFNRAFHRLLALEAARFFWYNDQQTAGNFDRKMQAEYSMLMTEMINWDDTLGGSLGFSQQPVSSWIPEVS